VVCKRVKVRRFPHGLLRFIGSSPVAEFENLDMLKRWLAAGRKIKVSKNVEARLINDEKGHVWFVKRYRSRSLFRVLQALLGWTRGERVFELSFRLREKGVNVPQPSACLMCRDGFQLDSWFVCEGLEGGKDLRNHFFEDKFESLGGAQVVMGRTAEVAANLHAKGFVHYDMKWANFMVAGDGQFYLIDLDGMRRPKIATFTKACRDAARFVVNAREFGLPEDHVRYWLSQYSMYLDVDVDDVEKGMAPFYAKFVRRHRKKYNVSL